MTAPSAQSLAEQLQQLQARIRRDASAASLRVHLFQLLCVLGQWKRALAQLQVCAQMDAAAIPMAQTYREAIACELFRAEVFAGKRQPRVLGTPPAWVALMIEALRHEAEGVAAHASDLRAEALDLAAPTACFVDVVACTWLADGDARLGPVGELIVNGQYYWLPFQPGLEIHMEAPADLRDLVWTPADLRLPGAAVVPALIPSRYPETAGQTGPDADALMQCRLTRWVEQAEDSWFGLGQRVWVSDVGEHALLDVRQLRFPAVEAATDLVVAPDTPVDRKLA